MNEKQIRVVRFLGTGALIGVIVGLCLPWNSAEQVISCAIFGMTCGAALGWFTALR